jgi:hypothetical protein
MRLVARYGGGMASKRPDSLPRGWLKDKIEAGMNRSKIADPAVRVAMVRRATTGFDLGVRIRPEDIRSRRWPEPPPES